MQPGLHPSSQRFVARLRCYRIDRSLAILPFLTVASRYLLFQRPRMPPARRNDSPTQDQQGACRVRQGAVPRLRAPGRRRAPRVGLPPSARRRVGMRARLPLAHTLERLSLSYASRTSRRYGVSTRARSISVSVGSRSWTFRVRAC